QLRQLYWKEGCAVAKAMTVWEDLQRYLYLPRLKNRGVYEQALTAGAAGTDFFGIAYGQAGDKYEGFQLGAPHVQLDDTLLLIEPEAARAYQEAQRPPSVPPSPPETPPETPPEGHPLPP